MPVAAAEEQGRLFLGEHGRQIGLVGAVPEVSSDPPAVVGFRYPIGQRLDQLLDAQPGRLVAGISHAEEGRAAAPALLACFRLYQALGIAGILLGGLEVNAPHRVLDIELKLEPEGNGLGAGDDQQVVGHPSGTAGPGPMPWRARNRAFDSPGR